MKFLNDMLDFFLIVDNSFKPSMCRDIELEISKYVDIKSDLNSKITKFPVDKYVKTEKSLQRFYQNNNFYKSKIMD